MYMCIQSLQCQFYIAHNNAEIANLNGVWQIQIH